MRYIVPAKIVERTQCHAGWHIRIEWALLPGCFELFWGECLDLCCSSPSSSSHQEVEHHFISWAGVWADDAAKMLMATYIVSFWGLCFIQGEGTDSGQLPYLQTPDVFSNTRSFEATWWTLDDSWLVQPCPIAFLVILACSMMLSPHPGHGSNRHLVWIEPVASA